MLIAQITDTHIKPEGVLAYERVDTAGFLARAVDHILHLDPWPDVVLPHVRLQRGSLARQVGDEKPVLVMIARPAQVGLAEHLDPNALGASEHAYGSSRSMAVFRFRYF